MKIAIIGLVTLIIVAGGGLLLFGAKSPSKPTATKSTNTTNTQSTSNTTNQSTTTSTSGTTDTVTITANDDSASPETITAKKGDTVKVTFVVSSQGTYHGGLEFKSTDPPVDSGSIAEGNTKTISFTATKSFKFTPYWYESSIQKDYFVSVNVQ